MYIPFQVNICHKSILLILEYKYLKSCSEDLILKNPTKSDSPHKTMVMILLSTKLSWILHFRQAEIWLVEMICMMTTVVPASKGHLGGASP